MNKLIVSLIALGALSGAAFAEQASQYDREGIDQNFGLFSIASNDNTVTSPIAAVDQSGLSSFQKAMLDAKMESSDR